MNDLDYTCRIGDYVCLFLVSFNNFLLSDIGLFIVVVEKDWISIIWCPNCGNSIDRSNVVVKYHNITNSSCHKSIRIICCESYHMCPISSCYKLFETPQKANSHFDKHSNEWKNNGKDMSDFINSHSEFEVDRLSEKINQKKYYERMSELLPDQEIVLNTRSNLE